MNLNMQIIADRLELRNPKNINLETRVLNLSGVYLFLHGNMFPDNNEFVYASTLDTLLKCQMPKYPANIICIGNSDECTKLASEWGGSWIILDAPNELDAVFNETVDSFRFYERCAIRLINAIEHSSSLNSCLEIAAELLGNPLFIIDRAMTVIALADHLVEKKMNSQKWFYIINKGCVSINAFNDILKRGLIDYDDRPAKICSVYPNIYNSIHAGLFFEREKNALIVIPDEFKKIQNGDLALADYVAESITGLFHRQKDLRTQENSIFEQFLLNLVNGIQLEPVIVERYLQQINWHLKGNYKLIKIIPKDDKIYNFQHYDIKRIKILFQSSFYLRQNKSLVIIINNYQNDDSCTTRLTELTAYIKERDLVAGVSQKFNHFTLIHSHYKLIDDILERNTRLNLRKHINYCSDYINEHIIRFSPSEINMLALCRPEIIHLNEYDRENNTEFVDSLYAYLLNECSMQKAAAQLHVHKNTLVYRLNRSRDIIDLDYKDPYINYHILLSCDIIRSIDPSCFDVL